jgi:4-amino-4-deoxy-L-arabinose transferase-like glycosyltransferase
LAGLAGLLLLQTVVNFIWLTRDQSALSWDPAHHLRYGLLYADLFTRPALTGDWVMQVLGTNTWIHPPLYHWVMGLFLAFAGRSIFWAKFANLIWVTVLVVFTYSTGARLWNRRAGLLAAFLVSVYPMTFQFSREIYTDLSAAALTAGSLYFLLCSDHFRNLRCSLAFGAAVGLGLLTKPTYPTFVALPLLIIAVQMLREHSPWWRLFFDRTRWRTVGGAAGVAFVIALLWYGVMRSWFVTLFIAHLGWGSGSVFSFQSLSYYLAALVNAQVSLLFFLVLLAVIVPFSRSPATGRAEKTVLLAGILGILFVQTLILNKNDHQDIGILPFVALVTAGGILSIHRTRVKQMLVLTVATLGLAQFLALSFGATPPMLGQAIKVGPLTLYPTVPPRPPIQEDWRVREALVCMAGTVRPDSRPLQIAILANSRYVNGQTFRGLALLDRLPIEVDKPIDLSFDTYVNRFSGYDFVVTTSTWNPTYQPATTLHQEGIDREVLDYFLDHLGEFQLAQTLQLPDGSDMQLYRRVLPYGSLELAQQ